MPKTKEQLELLRNQRRQEIIRAATLIFAFVSYKEITVDRIVKEAKCSHGLFYHYFKSIDDIYDQVMQNSINLLDDKVFAKQYENRPPKEVLEIATQRYCDILNSDDDEKNASMYLLLSNRLRIHKNPELKKYEIRSIYATDKLLRIIEAGQKEGVFYNDDPVDLSRCLFSLITGLTFSRLYLGKNTFLSPDKSIILKLIIKE